MIAESLRMRPVVGLAGRRLAGELRVGEYVLPPGSDVHARDLAHPHARRPLPGALRVPAGALPRPRLRTTYAWIPFGGGMRRCLGAAFAEFEMRVVLETVLRHRTLRPASPHAEHVVRRNVTFSPRHGTRVHATARPAPSRRSGGLDSRGAHAQGAAHAPDVAGVGGAAQSPGVTDVGGGNGAHTAGPPRTTLPRP